MFTHLNWLTWWGFCQIILQSKIVNGRTVSNSLHKVFIPTLVVLYYTGLYMVKKVNPGYLKLCHENSA